MSSLAGNDLFAACQALIDVCRTKKLKITSAESCTGGLIAALLTEIPGSSDVFERGFVTYSNQAKIEMLGVSAATLSQFGAVSEETARAMAEGALAHSHAQLSVSITGIAGPGGGTASKPVGLVYIGCAGSHRPTTASCFRFGPLDRQAIRIASAREALQLLTNAADS